MGILEDYGIDEEFIGSYKGQMAETPKKKKPTRKYTDAQVEDWIDQASTQEKVDPSLIKAIMRHESNFKSDAVPKDKTGELLSSAYGYMQLLDGTSKDLGVDKYDPYENIVGGARYIKQQIEKFKDPRRALVAYFKGPGFAQREDWATSVDKTGGTTAANYADSILGIKKKYDAELSKALEGMDIDALIDYVPEEPIDVPESQSGGTFIEKLQETSEMEGREADAIEKQSIGNIPIDPITARDDSSIRREMEIQSQDAAQESEQPIPTNEPTFENVEDIPIDPITAKDSSSLNKELGTAPDVDQTQDNDLGKDLKTAAGQVIKTAPYIIASSIFGPGALMTKAVFAPGTKSEKAVASGAADLTSSILKGPVAAADAVAIAQNLFAKGINSIAGKKIAPTDMTARKMFNIGYDDWAIKALDDRAEKLWKELDLDPEKDAYDHLVKDKDPGKAAEYLYYNLLTQVPQYIGILATGGTAAASAILPVLAISSGASKMAEYRKRQEAGEDVPDEVTGILNAINTGLFEALFESLGTLPLVKGFNGMFSRLVGEVGEEGAKQLTKRGVKDILWQSFKGFNAEGFEELFTELATGFTDYISGMDKDSSLEDVLRRSLESYVLGGPFGGAMSGSTAAMRNRIARQQEQGLSKEDIDAMAKDIVDNMDEQQLDEMLAEANIKEDEGAEEIQGDEGQIQEQGDVGIQGEDQGGEDIQQPTDAGTEAGDQEVLAQRDQEGQKTFEKYKNRPRLPRMEIDPLAQDEYLIKKAESFGDQDFLERLQGKIEDARDDVLDQYGVTSIKAIRRYAKKLESKNIKYVLEMADGANLGGANAVLGTHEATNDKLREIWGEIYANNVRDYGGIIGRSQGDEFMVIWPGYTKAEVQEIRSDIERQMRAKVKELGLEDVKHPKRDYLPTGALYTSYGLVEAEPGKYRENEMTADELSEEMKKEDIANAIERQKSVAPEQQIDYIKEESEVQKPTEREVEDVGGAEIGEVGDKPQGDRRRSTGAPGKEGPDQRGERKSGENTRAVQESPEVVKGSRNLINKVKESFGKGEKLNNRKLESLADEAFEGTRAEGKYNPRDMYDAMEVAVNEYISENNNRVDFQAPEQTFEFFDEVGEKLARQSDRTTEQVEQQQFSTPPAEAFLAVKAAGIQDGMSVLEPSAGTGNIANLARMAGGNVVTNEIAPRRRGLLQMQGFTPTAENAEQLDNVLPENIQPDVVVMNPPFSASGGRTKSHDTKIGARHVEQALLRLKPGGRLVAIVGKGMAFGKPGFAKWWKDIAGKYNVRANIGIDGKYYGKYGTTFDNQLIVIDKTGPTPGNTIAELKNNVIRGDNLSPMDAYSKIEDLSKEDIRGRIGEVSESGSKATVQKPVRDDGRKEPGSKTVRTSREQREPVSRTTDGDGGADRAATVELGRTDTEQPGRSDAGTIDDRGPGGEIPAPDKEGKRPESVGRGNDGANTGRVATERGQGDVLGEEIEGTPYSRYTVQKASYPGAQPHSANLVESSTMASVEPPDVTYKLSLPSEVIKEGRLSDVQLEGVTYACQRHEQKLPNGTRAEYLIGDGTGVGKGRQIAGVIYENIQNGRKRHVWVSIGHDLANDARRDLEDVGVPTEVMELRDFKRGDKLPDKDGVLFLPYSLLRDSWKGNKYRYNQIKEWLGEGFDGVIVFDECHELKNAIAPGFGGSVSSKYGSDQGAAGVQLKEDFGNARFLNVSATAATTAANLGYLTRMGLWGDGAPFPTFPDFVNAMSGVGSMELLSRDLKATGAYHARSISYEGVDHQKLEHKLTTQEQAQYDDAAKLWSELTKAWEVAADQSGKKERQMTTFYSAQQRFFLQLMTTYQMPSAIAAAEDALKRNESVIFSMISTNEQAMTRKANEALASGDDADLDITPREMIVDLINNSFPVEQYEEIYNPDLGKTSSRLVKDSAGNPVLNKENLRMREELLDKVYRMSLPSNPMDMIIEHFGAKNVAEITGRKSRIEGGKLVKRKSPGIRQKDLNQSEINAFQSGRKRIALLSAAATTGISLHASKKTKNQQRRNLLALQLFWSADKQMQVFGRAHRTNQASAPVITLVSTDIAGQQRLINAVSRRLASLGAITRGGRETLGGGVFDAVDLTDEYGNAALQRLSEIIDIKDIEDMGFVNTDGSAAPGKMNNVDKFLNRIMALPFERQNKIFNRFYDLYKETVEKAKESGNFDPGVQKIKAKNMKLVGEPEVVHTHSSGAQTKIVTVEGEVETQKVPFENVEGKFDFYKNNNSGMVYALSREPVIRYNMGMQEKSFKLKSTRGNTNSIEAQALSEKYTKLTDKEAKTLWDKQFKEIPDTEKKKYHLITGAVMPLYNKIFAGKNMKVKVNRAILNNNKSHIGIRIKQSDIEGIRQRLGIGSPLADKSGQDIYGLVTDGSVIELDNGWMLKETMVHGQPRVELVTGFTPLTASEIERIGLFEEIIKYKKRYFVPRNSEDGPRVIENILAQYKAVRDATSREAEAEAEYYSMSAREHEVEMPKEAQTEEKINKTQIIKLIEKLFGLTVRQKGTYRWKDLGRYYPEQFIIRMGKWGELEVMAHEVAHHISATLKNNRSKMWMLKGTGSDNTTIKNELKALDYAPNKARMEEGFAEFMRHYLTTGKAKEKAPTFYKHFQNILKEEVATAGNIAQLKNAMRVWYEQGAENRLLQQIDFNEEHTRDKSITAKRKRAAEWVKRQLIDALYPIKDIEKEMGVKVGVNIRPTESPYAWATMMKGKGAAITRTFVELGAITPDGQIVGKSLQQSLDPISYNDMSRFIAYAAAKRAINLDARGIESGFDIDDCKWYVDKYSNDTWDQVATDVTTWSNQLMDWLVWAGNLSDHDTAIMRELNPIYLPFKRAFSEELVKAQQGGSGAGVHRIKGSGRPILNPIESLVQQCSGTINKAMRIQVTKKLVELAEKTNRPDIITEMPTPKGVEKVSVQQVVSQLNEMGISTDDATGDEILTILTTKPEYRGKENIISIWRNGERKFYEVNKEMYEALSSMDMTARNAAFRIMGVFTRLKRLGAVEVQPAFIFVKNAFRDMLSYMGYTKSGAKTPIGIGKGALRVLAGEEGTTARFRRMGGEMSGMMGYDRRSTMRIYDEMLAKKLNKKGRVLWALRHPGKMMDCIRDVGTVIELAPRSAEVDAMYKKYKKEQPEWNDMDCFLQAFNDAQDVTVNFTRGGILAKKINMTNAFFNVSLQDIDKVRRTIKERPVDFAIRGLAYLSTLAISSWLMNKDEDWYKNLDREYKYTNFFLKVTDDVIVRLPIPFGIGTLFCTSWWAALDGLNEKSTEPIEAYFKVVQGSLPPLIPDIMEPMYRVWRNKNWLGKPIEPKSMTFTPTEERVRPWTPKTAVMVADMWNAAAGGLDRIGIPMEKISPINVEFLINQYTGGLARDVQRIGDIAVEYVRRKVGVSEKEEPIVKELADIPVVGDVLLRRPGYPRRQLNTFFEEYMQLKNRSDKLKGEDLARYNKLKSVYSSLKRAYFGKLQEHYNKGNKEKLKEWEDRLRKRLSSVGIK